jgi:hypothetical protein
MYSSVATVSDGTNVEQYLLGRDNKSTKELSTERKISSEKDIKDIKIKDSKVLYDLFNGKVDTKEIDKQIIERYSKKSLVDIWNYINNKKIPLSHNSESQSFISFLNEKKYPIVIKIYKHNFHMSFEMNKKIYEWSIKKSLPNIRSPYLDGTYSGEYIQILEYEKYSSMTQFYMNHQDEKITIEILLQVLFTIAMIQEEYPDFMHCDLHRNNIMVKKYAHPLNYILDGETYTLNSKYIGIISNFGQKKTAHKYYDIQRLFLSFKSLTSFFDEFVNLLYPSDIIIGYSKISKDVLNTVEKEFDFKLEEHTPKILVKKMYAKFKNKS